MANGQSGTAKQGKKVFVQRHGQQEKVEGGGVWGVAAQLTPDARTALVAMQNQLGVAFALVRTSPLIRAVQTGTIMAGNTMVEQIANLGPDTVEEWDEMGKWFEGNSSATALGQFKVFPELYKKYASRVGGVILQTVQDLQPGENALVVSHHPLVELGISFALGKDEPADEVFGKGNILVLQFDDQNQVITPADGFVRHK